MTLKRYCFLSIISGFLGLLSIEAFSQASVVAGSVTTSKTAYAVGAGNNRLIVVAVAQERNPLGTITSITWGGQPLTLARAHSFGAAFLRGEIWYLNEAGISTARGSCSYNFVVNWSAGPTNEVFTAFTLKDIDQTTPVAAINSAEGNATSLGTGNIAVGINDLVVYASTSSVNKAHTAAASYTEQSDQIIGGVGGTSMATATRAITVAATENPAAAWSGGANNLINVGVGFNGVAATTVRTFYSLATGAWDLNTSWSFSSDGSSGAVPVGVWPTRTDNVVIRTTHIITIDATDDNKNCGISPDGLGRSNVGPFPNSGTNMFYQTGDILIRGLLTVTVGMMIEGYTKVVSGGVFGLISNLVNLGFLEADAGSLFGNLNDISLAGNSTTIINTTSLTGVDLNISFTNATLCGTGSTILGSGASSQINYLNGATVAQICTTFTVTCIGIGCSGFPVVGTGPSSIGNSGPGGVASTDGTSELKVWLDASRSVFSNAGITPSVDGGIIQQWSDRSGSGNNATKTAGNEPTFDAVDPAINNAAAIDFTAASSNRFNLNTFTFNPAVSSFSIVSALNVGPTTAANQNIIQQKDGSGTGRTLLLYDNAAGKLTTFLGGISTAPVATYTLSSWTISSQTFNFNGTTTAINLFKAGTVDGSATVTPESSVGSWLIASNKTENGAFLNGSIGEVVILNQSINNAKRIIIENYLSAKYAIALTANDVYTMDNVGNGNFDFEVAGIGQASDGSKHIDAKGTGVVRMWNPSGLANSEFLMWGHDNTALNSVNITVGAAGVDGTIIQERLSRIWRAGESVDVGTVSVSFDLSTIGFPLGSNLRLLIDRDGDGFGDNDVTPVAGSFLNNIVVFSGINFNDGDRFTLGNTDKTISLPIELLNFSASLIGDVVKLDWSTASELNNDFFTVERASNIENFEEVTVVKGQGTIHTKTNYNAVDDSPLPGRSYYRLKQTDFDGKFSYSELRKVENADIKVQFRIYPSPVAGNKFNFELTGVDGGIEVPIQIVNMQGVSVFEGSYKANESGQIKTAIELNRVSSGMYIVIVNAATGLRRKILIQ